MFSVRLYVRLGLVWFVLALVTAEDQCPAMSSQCTCEFDGSAEDGGASRITEATSKSHGLAAAAGAMSPLLLGGAGLGIYKLWKGSRGDNSMDMDRASSSMSGESPVPPKYDSRRGSRLDSEEEEQDRGTGEQVRPGMGKGRRATPDLNRWMSDY